MTGSERVVFFRGSDPNPTTYPQSLCDKGLWKNSRGTMKKCILVLCSTIASLSFAALANAQTPIASCTTVETLPSKNFIYKNAAPLRAGGPGTTLVGFRKQPTLIMNKSYTRGATKIYDSQDNLLATCPWAEAHGHAGGRFRCTNSTIAMKRRAIKNTGSPTVYFVVNPRTKLCAEVPDSGKCYGSVKGLCTTNLK
jgi:hypothetical protein